MLAGQGNWPLRRGYRAACTAGAAYRFASHAHPGEIRRGGGQERGTLALVSAERKIYYRNDARFEGTTLERTTLGGSAAGYAPALAMEVFSSFLSLLCVFIAGFPSLCASTRTCEIRSATSNGLASEGTPCSRRKLRVSVSVTVENVSSSPFSIPGQVFAIHSYISRALQPPGMRPFITITSKDPFRSRCCVSSTLMEVVTSAPAPTNTSRSNSSTASSSSTRSTRPASSDSLRVGATVSGNAGFSLASKRTAIVAPPSSRLRATISPPCSLTIP